jgi:RHS repeat-associated protein
MAMCNHDHAVVGDYCSISRGETMTEYVTNVGSCVSLFFSALLVLLLTSSINAQTSVTDGHTPLGMAVGAPVGSYGLSDLDQVDLFSGNLNFAIPLMSIGGRGTAGFTMTLRPNGNRFHWRVIHTVQQTCGQHGCTITGHTYFPSINWWATIASQPGYTPGVLIGRKSGESPTQPVGCPDGTSIWGSTLTRITFSTEDGTEYELRDQLLAGQPQPLPGGTCGGQAGLRGKVWQTADGTALTFISDDNIYDHSSNPQTFYPSGYLLFRDGTRYRIDNGAVSWIRDRNGNQVTFSGGTIIDSLKRTVTYSYGEPDVISFKGFGSAPRTIQVSHTSLSLALRPCRPDPGYQCFPQQAQTYKQLFPNSDGSSVTEFNPSVVSALTLPDGRQYHFYYNNYAELARVDLPTGGVLEYDYAAGLGADSTGLINAVVGLYTEKAVYRRIVERRVYADGQNLEQRTTYSIDTNPTVVDHLKPTGELVSREKHYFYGSPTTTFFQGSNSYGMWNDGREYKTQIFSNDGTTELRRVENNWQQGCLVSPWSTLVPNNPHIADTTSTLEPATVNQVSKEVFSYDCYNNLTDKYEYDFGTGAPATNYTRRTHTDYLTINPVNGGSYDTLNPSSSNPDINATYHMRNLPSQTSVYDGAGGEKRRTNFEYDNYAVDVNHNALIPRSNITSICTVILSPTSCDNSTPTEFKKRGNVTATTSTVFVNGSSVASISAFSQFDIAGNIVKAIDGRGNSTTIVYDDVFGSPNNNARLNTPPTELAGAQTYAFATIVTNASNQSVYAKYDYYLGKPVNGEDLNGVVASGYFNDVLDRPTQIRRAVGTIVENQTTFAYADDIRVITTSSDRDANGDNLLVSKLLYDKMGRTTETRQYEDGTNYIATQTQYDALGRPFKTSNPFRPLSESAVWTIQAFDALGRLISVTTPGDNAMVTTSYSGNTVTVTDQAGKARKSVTDALGRLCEVYEDPSGVNYQTTYTYDVLDNLVKVIQGSQQRFFMYDSLSRLLRLRNPEQNVKTPALDLNDSVTQNSQWSIAYQYDSNSNLTQKTDARGVVSTYQYDALNRNTNIDYSDSTPDVFRQYDQAVNGKGRINQIWQSGSTTSITYIDEYDALGRPKVQRQRFETSSVWSNSYQVSRSYNLASSVTSQTYPSGHSVDYSYDAAGRMSSFTGNLGDGTNRTYSNNTSYSPFGGLEREQFGTNTPLYHKSFYKIRGQLFDTRLSSVNDTWDWNRGRLILYYSSNHLWGESGTDNNGNVRFAETWIPPQNATLDQADTLIEDSYSYDSLNRLASVSEQAMSVAGGWVWQLQFQQAYSYDRYGNRTINLAQTWGAGINNKQFTVDANTNRLGVPNGQSGTLTYDDAGNLSTDTYSGAGNRVYDAENRMTQAWGGDNQWQYYTYNADGQRTRRKINNQETWQIYGMDGELLAEYAANGAVASPQKEYGYRNGQLLITAEPAPVGASSVNVAAAGNGAVASASSQLSTLVASNAINGDHVGTASWWTDATDNGWPDSIQVDFAGLKTISEIDVYGLQQNPSSPVEPTQTMTSSYALTNFEVRYWTGSTWATVPGGTVSGNNKVWRKFTFAPLQTSKILVNVTAVAGDNHSQVVEIEAYTATGPTIQWQVADHLGTPRLVVDQTGAWTNTRRHDYLPFGEELFAGQGLRSSSFGYSGGDGVRQQFTQKERDIETGLDYFGARYYSSLQGRFTSPDEFTGGPDELFDFSAIARENPTFYADLTQPQSLNKFQYCLNIPLAYVDPDGHQQALQQRILIEEGYFNRTFQAMGAAADKLIDKGSHPLRTLSEFQETVQKALGTDRESSIQRSMARGRTRDEAEWIVNQTDAIADSLTVVGKISKAEEGVTLVSKVSKDKALSKLADEAGASVQKGIDKLTSQLANGNLNPGLGSKNLFGSVSYARARDGARVFFRQVGNKIEVLAKASKANEQAVIDRLKKLYDR